VNKSKVALWALRNPRARGLIIKGLKNRRVRGLAWAVAKRRIRRWVSLLHERVLGKVLARGTWSKPYLGVSIAAGKRRYCSA
jgi:hypothetical protein